jgi:hypothetical protein
MAKVRMVGRVLWGLIKCICLLFLFIPVVAILVIGYVLDSIANFCGLVFDEYLRFFLITMKRTLGDQL